MGESNYVLSPDLIGGLHRQFANLRGGSPLKAGNKRLCKSGPP